MKNLVLILSLVTTSLFAQNGINYQGAATDSDGAKLADQNISLKTSVLQGGVGGTTSYSETHNTITDQFGLFNVVIGQGEVVSGAFEGISWGADTHFLKVELDATGGTDYNLISTTQMMSVPYALYAENSGGGGNTMDLSVSQFGDTLFGLGNDFLIIPGLSQSNLHMQFNEYGSVTDDWGNTYKTLIYGDAEWMVENLRSPIGDYKTVSDHSGGFQSYEDSVGYYYSASDISSNVCPTGWHVSTIQDWQDLHYEIYGTNMNPDGYTNPGNGYDDNNYSILWSQYQGGTNQSAFNLFRTGYWDNSGSYITSEPETANFWSTDGCNGSGLYRVNLIHGNDSFNPWALDVGCTSTSNLKAQVRCVKD